jgi:hypothetical protein
LKDLLKSKDEQLREKDRKLMEMGQELSAMATERDALRRTLQGFSTTGELPDSLMPKRLDFTDFITLALPTAIAGFIARYANYETLVGALIGLLLGAYLVSRRK